MPRPPLSLLQDLPDTLLVHTLTFLTPAKPGVNNSYQSDASGAPLDGLGCIFKGGGEWGREYVAYAQGEENGVSE